MPRLTCQFLEWEDLDREYGVALMADFSETEEIQTLKKAGVLRGTSRGKTIESAMALKFSAFYPTTAGEPTSPNVFMLGWDHACLIEYRNDLLNGHVGYYLVKIYAHSRDESSNDARVYQISGGDNKTLTQLPETRKNIESIETGEHECEQHKADCEWRTYDVRDLNIKLKKLVTFSLTSCSFSVLWPDDGDYLAVSHIAFAPPIPVVWMAKTGRVRRVRSGSIPRRDESTISKVLHFNLLASVNASYKEMGRFNEETLPHAKLYDIDEVLLSRGPLKRAGDGDDAPYKTHPYVKLDFDHAKKQVKIAGTRGYNNDPTLQFVEMPAFHSLGQVCDLFDQIARANKIDLALAQKTLDLVSQLIAGDYGFERLHAANVDHIWLADMKEALEKPSDKLNALCNAGAIVPGNLKGKDKAAFRLAEFASTPKKDLFPKTFEVVLGVWKALQAEFSFPIDKLHQEMASATTTTASTSPTATTTTSTSTTTSTTPVTQSVSPLSTTTTTTTTTTTPVLVTPTPVISTKISDPSPTTESVGVGGKVSSTDVATKK